MTKKYMAMLTHLLRDIAFDAEEIIETKYLPPGHILTTIGLAVGPWATVMEFVDECYSMPCYLKFSYRPHQLTFVDSCLAVSPNTIQMSVVHKKHATNR